MSLPTHSFFIGVVPEHQPLLCRLTLLWIAIFGCSSLVAAQEVQPEEAGQPLLVPTGQDGSVDTKESIADKVVTPKTLTPTDKSTSEKPRIGVVVLDSPGRGVFVAAVDPFGSAMRAGLRPGDYIIDVDTVEVASPQTLRQEIARRKAGDTVTVRIWRCGVESLHEVKLKGPRLLKRLVMPKTPRAWLGVTLAEVDGDGARIVSVTIGSPAGQAGLSPGDVVIAAGGEEVDRVEDLIKLVRQRKPDETMQLVILRADQELTLTAKLGTSPVNSETFFRGPFEYPLNQLREWRQRRPFGPNSDSMIPERGWHFYTPPSDALPD